MPSDTASHQGFQEPEIIINGLRLTNGQAMAVRVAVSSFLSEMSQPNALGDDETGRAIAQGYLNNLREITAAMQRQT